MPGGLTLPGQSLPKVKTPPDLRMTQISRNWSNSRLISKLDEVAWSLAHWKDNCGFGDVETKPFNEEARGGSKLCSCNPKASQGCAVVPSSAVDSPAAPVPLRAVCHGERSSWLHSEMSQFSQDTHCLSAAPASTLLAHSTVADVSLIKEEEQFEISFSFLN